MANFRQHVKVSRGGGLATVYSCPLCKFSVINYKGMVNVGRGHGLRMGSKAHAAVANHIKAEHPTINED